MANIPLFINDPLVDKNGKLTDSWQLAMTQLLGQLQQGISDESGFQVPQKSASDIAQLTNVPDGTHLYDTTNKTPVVKKNGVFVPYG
jgi:hypothetical protein